MIKADMLLPFAHFRLSLDPSRINWEELVPCQMGANDTYSKQFYKQRCRESV